MASEKAPTKGLQGVRIEADFGNISQGKIDRQIDGQIDRYIDGQIDRYIDRQIYRQIDRQVQWIEIDKCLEIEIE